MGRTVASVIGSCEVERHITRHLASLGLRVGPQLYDGNADGVSTLHAKCDNQGLTLTLAPTSQGPVAGIQTLTGATAGTWVSQDDAAIITKSGVYRPTAGVQYATYQNPTYLPTWGGGHCLCLGTNCNSGYGGAYMGSHPASYSQPEAYPANNFVVQNVVVFKLVKGRQVAPKSDISKHLHANGHFPVDEIQLLSAAVELEADADDAFSGASATVEQINCTTLDATKGLAAYCSNVPAALRSLKRVVVSGKVCSTIAAVVNNLKLVFSKVDGAAAPHTLILKNVSSDLVCAVVDAQLTQLSRLVLESSSVDLDKLLPLVAKNNHLEELCLESVPYAFHLGSDTLALVRQCPHICFNSKPDLSVPPPKAAATIQYNSKPLQEAMKLGAFNKLCKEKEAAKLEPPIALAAAWGQVVPFDRKLISRFQLLEAMLKDGNNDADEGEENVVHWGDEAPTVSKKAVELAVHFVTHHVTDEVERECARAEELRGEGGAGDGAPVAGGGGGQDQDAGGGPVTHTWCAEFAQFRTIFIQQRYARGARVHVMCELMAIACYFNCPSLKRFLRAALVMEEHEDSDEA